MIGVISVDLDTFLCLNNNRYPFKDDTKKPKINLPASADTFRKLRRVGEHHRTAKSS